MHKGGAMKTIFILLPVFLLSGCLTRNYVVEKPRTDLEISQGSNRGYLEGSPSEPVEPNRFGETRKVSVLEVELGPHERKPWTRAHTSKPQATQPAQESAPAQTVQEPVAAQEPRALKEAYQEYVVQKDDTLQKISQKFYGTTKKWSILYQENKETLKSPDKVYPGLKLKIPQAQ